MGAHLNYSGLVVAGIGFFLTRFTVTLALYEDPTRFYLAGTVPLALGLGVAAFGVALTVADVERSLVRTTARWCVIGTGVMLVLVVLTLLGSTPGGVPDLATVRSRTYLSNFLIGGCVGGTLTGLYAARTRRQRRELRQQANRLEVLHRMLRHEVLNAVTVIRGYATVSDDETLDAATTIETHSDAIEETIEDVKYLTWRGERGRIPVGPTDLGAQLEASIEAVRTRRPDVDISVDSPSESPTVIANDRLQQVFAYLLENAVVHGEDDEPRIEVATTRNDVRVGVVDEGPGLPERQRALLESGDIGRFDDPESGYGLNIVRLLVESYGGRIETDVDETGTTVTVVLPRASESAGLRLNRSDVTGVRPDLPDLIVTLTAAIVAGVFYGIASRWLGGSIAGIGVFYGTANAVVGWIAHEFHSVVFGFVFASLVSVAPERYRGSVSIYAGIGLGWALVLWLVAAGFVAPIWLRLLGIDAPIPNVSRLLLVTHLVWGLSLGLLTALGYEHATPRVARLLAGFRDRFGGDRPAGRT